MYEAGEFMADDMKKRLVGSKRQKFIADLDLNSRIRARELELRKELEADDSDGLKHHDLLDRIDKPKNELAEANKCTSTYAKALSSTLKLVVGFWDASRQHTMITTKAGEEDTELLEQHKQWKWPTEPSIDAFYQITVFLIKFDDTDNVRSDSCIRDMKSRLHHYILSEKEIYEGPIEWDRLEGVFNQSADLVKAAEIKYTQHGPDDLQAWYESQDVL